MRELSEYANLSTRSHKIHVYFSRAILAVIKSEILMTFYDIIYVISHARHFKENFKRGWERKMLYPIFESFDINAKSQEVR